MPHLRAIPYAAVLCLALWALATPLHAADDFEVVSVFRFENGLPDTQYTSFHKVLEDRMMADLATPELHIKAWDLKFNDMFRNNAAKRAKSRVAVFGSFGIDGKGLETLTFKILDMESGAEDGKTLPLRYMEKEDIAQIIVLKLKNFLEKSMLGKLNVTTVPLGLDIRLNRKKAGITPKEFLLKTGKYSLEIYGKNLYPYTIDAEIVAGKTLNIEKKMDFKGYPTKYWFMGALATTWECIVVWILEERLYREHRDFGTSYNTYRYANAARIGLLSLSGIGWIGAGYCYYSNKSTKKRIFSGK